MDTLQDGGEKAHMSPAAAATAPADATTDSPPSRKPSTKAPGARLNPRSCVTCRRRKVRCNKENPCANCVRAGIECVFPGPGRAPRKSKKLPEAELLARLKRLEGVVHSLGAQVDDHGVVLPALSLTAVDLRTRLGDALPGDSPTSDRSEPKRQSIDKHLGRLVISDDKSRYLSNAFWTGQSDEISELHELLDTDTTDDDDDNDNDHDGRSPDHPDRPANHTGFLFGYASIQLNLRDLHPTPSQIFILWEIFKENVDPVARIIHRPTTRTILMNASSNLDRVSKAAESLLFALYFGAVVSMTADQCRGLMDERKETMVQRYRFATEQALARADFLNNSSLMCLQALTYYLVFLRHCDDSRLGWALGGLATHLAQALGVHRDGAHFGLNTFDTEMRRRLWWQLSISDNRAAEDHGTEPLFSEQIYDTRLPLNVNDEDIYPGMTAAPVERPGATEMTFCLVRFELSVFSRRFNFQGFGRDMGAPADMTLEEKDQMIDECYRYLEEKYLRHCDMSVPIYWVTATVARLILAKMWLTAHQPRSRSHAGSPIPPEIRDRVFITSVEVLEFSHLLERNENTAKWGWLFRSYIQWQSVAFALSEICSRPPGPDVDRAWRAIDSLHEERAALGLPHFQRGMLCKPLRHLMAKANAVRAAHAAEQQKARTPPNPALGAAVPEPPKPMTNDPYMQLYPDSVAGAGSMDAFGMESASATLFGPALAAGPMLPDVSHRGNGPDPDVPGALPTVSDPKVGQTVQMDDVLKFGWSPTLGDFNVPDPYPQSFMNLQEEWL